MYSSVHHNSLSSLLLIHFTFLASEAFECAIPEPWGTLELMKYIYRYIDIYIYITFYQFSHSLVSDSLGPHGLQHARLP